MSDVRAELKRRFSRQSAPAAAKAAAPVAEKRRRDYKGGRVRLTIRVPEELAMQLHIFATATQSDKNGFCEAILREALEQRLAEEQRRYGAANWEVILSCARSARKKLPSD